MKKRVGILTSGGDCPGLNATLRGVAKALYQRIRENTKCPKQFSPERVMKQIEALIDGEKQL